MNKLLAEFRRVILAAAALLCLGAGLPAQQKGSPSAPLAGRWAGLFAYSGQSLEFEINFVEGGCLFSVPAQDLYGHPCVSLERRGASLEITLFDSPAKAALSGKLEEGAIRGTYSMDGKRVSDFSLKPSVIPGREGIDYKIDTGKGVLPGTLLLPDAAPSSGKVPVVLILSDSGPVDRDGNDSGLSGRNDALALLAGALRQVGVASLRYDKRGSGESSFIGGDDQVFEDYIRDATKAAQILRADGRFSKLIVAGHGQGSLVGTVAAARSGADGFVSLAGVGLPAWKTLQGQLERQAAEEGSPLAGLKGEWEKIVSELRAGRRVAKMDERLEPLFGPALQGYLASWFSFDPQDELKKLKVPVLLILGGNDAITGPEDAKALEAGAPGAKEAFLPDMNHVLKSTMPTPESNEASYSDPAFPLASGLQALIGDFAKGL